MPSNESPIASEEAPHRPWSILFILTATTLAVLWRLATSEFLLWDDRGTIWANPLLNPPTLQSIGHYWRHSEYGLYIPLTYTVWGLLAQFASVEPDNHGITLNPWIFHVANLVVHVIAVWAVWAILRRLISDRRAACLGAMLFAIHPVQVESVGWASGLKDVLSGMLALVCTWQYLVFAQHRDRSSARVNYALASIAFVLALLAKPSALVVPIIAFAIDWILIRRPVRAILIALSPWLCISIAFAIVAKLVQPAVGVTPAPYWVRPFVAGDALAFYLYKLVWPVWLGIDYGRRPAAMMQHGWFYFTWLVPAALAIILLINRKRFPEFVVAGLIFVAGVAPVLGISTFLFQHYSTTADHYLYLSMLGPSLALAWVVHRSQAPAVTIGAAVLLSLFAIRSMNQTRVWKDDVVLFTHARAVNPKSFVAPNNLGVYYQDVAPQVSADFYRQAIELQPQYPDPHDNLADTLHQLGQFDEAIVWRLKAEALYKARPPEIQTNWVSFYTRMGLDYLAAGRYPEARESLEKASRLRPSDQEVRRGFELLENEIRQAATRSSTTRAAPTQPVSSIR